MQLAQMVQYDALSNMLKFWAILTVFRESNVPESNVHLC